MTTRAAVGAVAVVLAAGLAAADEPATVNEKVLAFAKGKLGEQVGNGECWTLAHEAVRAAGAKSSGAYKDSPAKGDYVWGEPVYAGGFENGKAFVERPRAGLKPAPGDIVQFRDAKFEGKRPGGGTYSATATHHTAIISGVGKDGGRWAVLHQNHNGKKSVIEGTLVLGDLRAGWVRVYRPQPE